ncbi:isoamylase early set domain-containing protein [Marinitoga lauensis]|uniref:isoamylase early set domain-containing protein n=1 Tax=Marinitoga lauensis TaxID=2201189 RepID=UPI00101243F7|nr:isoamylase early set domain-containing protein [Marinitoga lauensis]
MKKFLLFLILVISIISFSKVFIKDGMVVFEYKDLTASKVYLAGSFNNWDPSALEMKKIKSGLWRVSLKLSPGDYQYKFVINGTDWKEDPDAPDYVPDGFGGKNGAFTIVLENGNLKINKPEKSKKQENSLLKGQYLFNLKSKIDKDTYSLKTPEISHDFYLTITPEKSGMKFEAALSANNDSWQLNLNSLKVIWENSNYAFGIFKDSKLNELINFKENTEENKTGILGIFKTNILKFGIDVYSQDNKLNYFVSSNIYLNNILLSALYMPKTEDSTMNIYARAEVFGVGVEAKYSNRIEYIKGDYNNGTLFFESIYDFINKNISFDGSYNELVTFSGRYLLENNIYNIESDFVFGIKSGFNVLADVYYDNSSNLGYKLGFELKKDNIDLKLKVGHDFSKDFDNYYLFITSSAIF